jgi:hypothetical protein
MLPTYQAAVGSNSRREVGASSALARRSVSGTVVPSRAKPA